MDEIDMLDIFREQIPFLYFIIMFSLLFLSLSLSVFPNFSLFILICLHAFKQVWTDVVLCSIYFLKNNCYPSEAIKAFLKSPKTR